MTVDFPPEMDEEKEQGREDRDGSPALSDPSVDDLLRELLVDETSVRVDPVSGRAIPKKIALDRCPDQDYDR